MVITGINTCVAVSFPLVFMYNYNNGVGIMSDLNIKVSQMEGNVPVTVIHAEGSIDAGTVQQLDTKAEEILEIGGIQNILLDLTEIKYMSSAGFRAMHKIYTALNAREDDASSIKLLNPSDAVKRIMKAMGFDIHFETYDDLMTAVDAF